ncbi:transcriptional regulator [Enemella evansiae]|uniref:Transcriptional regulator n=1 Tax=Enemella evansiae TaxID=2016499 RepID=A0A255GBW6_9ACTN|nr:LCP family protein [Enemella evansiae]OYO11773.1 transcriptional regulator [Enemella evansiae]
MTRDQDQLSFFADDTEPTPDDQPAKAETAPRRRGTRRALIVLLSLVAVLAIGAVAAVGFYTTRLNKAVSQIQRDDLMPARQDPAPAAIPTPTAVPPGGLNYVLLGTDSAPGDAGRSDSLMVAHIPKDRSKIYLISFPRDSWVDIPGRGKGKINWAYAFGGAPLTVSTLEQLLNVKMDHTAVVDFSGFIALTEALGGVEVYNKNNFSAGGYRFEQGWITVRGEQALAFVRERKSLPNGDLDRAENQRAVVSAIMEKASKPETLANPVAVDRLLTDASKVVKVDRGLSDDEIRKTATSMRITRSSDIVSTQAPIVGFGWAGDQSIAVVDEKQTAELAKALREDTMDDYLNRFPKSCTGPDC